MARQSFRKTTKLVRLVLLSAHNHIVPHFIVDSTYSPLLGFHFLLHIIILRSPMSFAKKLTHKKASTPKKTFLPSASEDIFDAERIIDERSTADGAIEYLIKWRGYSASWNSWEPVENLIDPRLLEGWKVKKEEKKKKRKTCESVSKMIQNKKRRKSYVPRKLSLESVSSSGDDYNNNNMEVNDQSMAETNQEANKEPDSTDNVQMELSFSQDESTLSANEGDQSEAGISSLGPEESQPSAKAVLASELQLEPKDEPTVLYTLVNTNGFTVTLTEYLNGKFPYQTQN